MDNILGMMEKYAYNLEEIVEERTQQLVEEKKKTDRLLFRMLPSYVSSVFVLRHSQTAVSLCCAPSLEGQVFFSAKYFGLYSQFFRQIRKKCVYNS